jgi:hypothetical protein
MDTKGLTQGELYSALFSNLVLQEGNMALMLLGKVPHPETGETVKDVESAKLFIDQVEMLAVKTKGNLNPDEHALLNQTLTTIRMAYVDEARKSSVPASARAGAKPESSSKPEPAAPAPATQPAIEDESKKKFVKRY